MSEILSLVKALTRTAAVMAGIGFAVVVILAAVYFPYDYDEPTMAVYSEVTDEAQEFYEDVYAPTDTPEGDGSDDHKYVQFGQKANQRYGGIQIVENFVKQYELADDRVLEVGAGSGQLQDLVDDYTGLDIAASARRYFHKPFVVGSATALPFEDNEFDAIWSVWVLEHVPNPEQALREMRRVVKPGGLILHAPAYYCPPWAADGYEKRPYNDFRVGGRMVKASLIVRANTGYRAATAYSTRFARRLLMPTDKPTRFRYSQLDANFEDYWIADGDAVNSLDPDELMLWHTSRGDECLTCVDHKADEILVGQLAVAVRVNKSSESPQSIARQ